MITQEYILLILAILPVIALAIFIYMKDKYEKEPFRMLLKAFLFGCLSVVPASLIESGLSLGYSIIGGDSLPGVVTGLFTGFVVAGCSEELCKLFMLRWAVWRSKDFDEYFDGIVYATFVSLGFACVENVMYVFGQDTFASAFMTGSIRAILSVPGHFLFGVVMGYYFSLAKFDPANRAANLTKAFLYPMLLHGTFDALLMIPEAMGEDGELVSGLLFVVFIYFDIRMWKIAIKRLNHLQELSSRQQSGSYGRNGNGGYGSGNGSYDRNNGSYGSNNGGYGSGNGGYDRNNGNGGHSGNDPFSGFNWDV